MKSKTVLFKIDSCTEAELLERHQPCLMTNASLTGCGLQVPEGW